MRLYQIYCVVLLGFLSFSLENIVIASESKENELSVKGVVYDTEQNPVSYANVYVKGTVKGALTDAKGKFQLFDLEKGVYEVQISAVGYKTKSQVVEVDANGVLDLGLVVLEIGVEMPEFSIIANKDRIFSQVPGAVNYLNKEDIKSLMPVSGNEVFRRVSGLNVVDEEGLGMRVNIGIRGLNPDRSRNVLMLEDGVPVALAPYGEPEMYYSPAIDRMAGVEILKGSGQILYGPQTIGGVVNYITPNAPETEQGSVQIQGGQGSFFSGLVNYGNTFGNTGLQVNLLRKSADNVGPTQFGITDFNTKFLFKLNEKSELGAKFGIYDERSNSTYIGLNQVMFDQGGQDFTRLAPDDRLDVSRYSLSFSHVYRFNPDFKLRTIAYGYTTTRNWNRQDFSINNSNTPPSNWTGVVWGDTSIPGGAIFMRDGTGQRNRQFEVAGIEPRIELNHGLFGQKNELKAGVRFLVESAKEQRVNGTKAGVKSGNLIEDELRNGRAFSAYFQNETELGEKVSLHGGLRFENFNYERNIFRRNFSGIGVRDTSIVASNAVNEIIPGVGFTVKPTNTITLFGGIHKGFAPPRTKDAITSTGDALDLEAERSWNYEAGVRSELNNWIYVEATAFLMDFSNQIIPVSESAGGLGFGVVNAGATRHQGLETSFIFDLSRAFGLKKWAIDYDIQATFIDAYFSEDRFIGDVNINGNTTPYAPEWLLNSSLAIESESGFSARLTYNFVGDQFGDEVNSIEPSANGRTGLIPSFFTLDAVVGYEIKKANLGFNLSVKNLTDERYISTRRPQGIRVGLPRFITAGVNFNF
ncbi:MULTISPECIES: TonB-dependent receptor [unclassified Algoriphagus]|jgi:Fe(3+) dicitrate transport protein|uniref:TonB-dependent receptor n=1 Tax=unclassified Algoriphagus TaxID=2641541 RepID=UPI000C5E720C|nr:MULTISPECIES: TonB-dependent receptor [unclassified Algoriphagus]MAL13176.1 Fe3+-dicitrate receptor [Algoriphagus sp.]HCB45779.1 Fe3+-dicitrate receptor [Algoriphagus sp.]HCH45422.1 Fe3+-dicitrate receptor [Algoriphagus sp.]